MPHGQTLEHPPETPSTRFETIGLGLVRATCVAAASCRPWIGAGDKVAADRAAVEAMRHELATVPGHGVVVIGEGEKDAAPMLYAGEALGSGGGPSYDIAVDPLEGTTLCATGTPGAITVLAAAPRGALTPLSGYYMNKLVVGSAARGEIDLDDPIEDNLRRIAVAEDLPLAELRVAVLARPRHHDLIRRIRSVGAGVVELRDGDVMASVAALLPDGDIHVSVGVGGAPEGVITACAVAALGGDMHARLEPQGDAERRLVEQAGQLDRLYATEDLVASKETIFAASGVTGSALLPGVTAGPAGSMVHSLLATDQLGLVRLSCAITGHML